MGEAGPDHQLRRSHSDQDLWTRQQQLDRAAEFYTAVGPDGECRNKSTGQRCQVLGQILFYFVKCNCANTMYSGRDHWSKQNLHTYIHTWF